MNKSKAFSTNELVREAVFSDETVYYRTPEYPKKGDTVNIKIRTAKNDCDEVYFINDSDRILMPKTHCENGFDFYAIDFIGNADTESYYFEIRKNNVIYYYSRLGVSGEILRNADFKIIYDFDIPHWSKGCVMYQIYVERFFDGCKDNNVKSNEYIYLKKPVKFKDNWYEMPEEEDIRNFYGGDLQGVIEKLPYLKELGIEAIYFNPIFVSPSNHKYDIQDYNYVDPHIAVIKNDNDKILDDSDTSNENAYCYKLRTTDIENLELSNNLLVELIEKAHLMGIKVILDGVFNHCGAFNKWMDKENIYPEGNGAYLREDSPYNDYFIWNEKKWPENEEYLCWWDHKNHPKLNFEKSEKLFDEIMDVGKKWVSQPFNADGWRIDVGADLGQSIEYNHYFWKKFRKSVKNSNNNAVILAEHYGDASSWLNGKEWDTVMNYDAFMDPLSYFFTGMEKHSDSYRDDLFNNGGAFANAMVQNMAKLPYWSLYSSMNQISNHDHSRFMTRTNKTEGRLSTKGSASASENIDKDIFKEAVLFQMMWPGCPTVYYGDEAGLCGWTDPDNRRTYPWGKEDSELIEYHKDIISLRKENDVIKNGSVMFLNEEYGIISFARFDDKDIIITVFNNNEYETSVNIPVWRSGAKEGEYFKTIFATKQTDNICYAVNDGIINIKINSKCGVVLKNGN